ncbi:uncharacterized protein LACBIDRAFT_301329 [Laccaria bicolor S238N-H82]|uniref:Predicted protein n=1 Tax=Laccaria bicolor (strain S238N-H82 / ATCC MYA-4686) TaxID=486041 RepID=B0CNA4_LACBS|nr:uncharacterized protein LACBIDRAFT_301329 [Laccaria bicolor S238N-H82]EDR15896.1 predicted protein [Laccaria bicolor S238N-H82]|eukprot:XP_001874104.1 predicted protein [Laccaria bicolor S238N-H82]
MVLNLVKLIPRLILLDLWISTNNFTPEHLEELLERPIPRLTYLSLSYLIKYSPSAVFRSQLLPTLKGAYFDSTLIAISRWPPSALATISIVQDPVPQEEQSRPAFAQLIVFFRLQPSVSILIHSKSLSSSLTSVRLRVPSRPVASAFCLSASAALTLDTHTLSISELIFIDLCTSPVLNSEIDTFSVRFKTLIENLQHVRSPHCVLLLHHQQGSKREPGLCLFHQPFPQACQMQLGRPG